MGTGLNKICVQAHLTRKNVSIPFYVFNFAWCISNLISWMILCELMTFCTLILTIFYQSMIGFSTHRDDIIQNVNHKCTSNLIVMCVHFCIALPLLFRKGRSRKERLNGAWSEYVSNTYSYVHYQLFNSLTTSLISHHCQIC